MGRSMARDAGDTVGREFAQQRAVTVHPAPFLCLLVTGKAIGIVIASDVSDWVWIGASDVVNPVPKSIPLPLQGAGNPVRHVAGITLILRDPVVSVMASSQRGAGVVLAWYWMDWSCRRRRGA